MKLVLQLWLVLICACFCPSLSAASLSAELNFSAESNVSAESKPTEPLVLVMGEDSFPYQYVTEEGKPAGLLVDLWREWGKLTHSELVFVPRQWNDSVQHILQGNAQVHLGIGQSVELTQRFDFAKSIAQVNTYLYLHKSLLGKKTVKELLPYQIGVVVGSSHMDELQRIEPRLVFKSYPSRDKLLAGVVAGEILVFAGLEGYLKDPSSSLDLAINFPHSSRILIKTMSLAPAVKKRDREVATVKADAASSLVAKIDAGFAAMDPQFIRQVERRWLGYHRQSAGLVISVPLDAAPFAELGIDGHPHGLYVDMWQLWSQRTGIAVDFTFDEPDRGVDDVRQGLVDAHIGYAESEELKTGLSRAWPLYKIKSRLFLYQQSVTQISQLKGRRIGVLPSASYLTELRQALPDIALHYYDNLDAMVAGAQAGEIVGFVAPGAWASHLLLLKQMWGSFIQHPELEFTTQAYVLTRNNDPGLIQRITRGFNSISPYEFAQIEGKWMLDPKDHIFSHTSKLHLDDSEQTYINSLGELKFGYLKQWPPMEFSDDKGEFAGVNSDIAHLFTEQLQLKLKPVAFNDWNALFQALQRGDIALAGSVAKTAERQQGLAFSEAYWPAPWGLVSTVDHGSMLTISQLAGQRVAVVEGYHLVAQLMGQQPSLKLLLVADTKAGLTAVRQGHAEVFIDKVAALSAELKGEQFTRLKMSFLSDLAQEQSHIGVNPAHQALVPLLNRVLAQIDSQHQQQIYSRWISLPESRVPKRLWLSFVYVFGVLAMLAALITWSYQRLNRETLRRIAAEKRLAHIESHDRLTQLPNRLLLDDRISQALLAHKRDHHHFALLFIDLDGFKQINQQHGHLMGDGLLLNVAQLLNRTIRGSDTLGRFGDDEFVILLNRVQDRDAAIQVAANILQSLSSPLLLDGVIINIAVSIGLVMYPRDGDTAIELLKKADQLLYQAKSAGGSCYRVA